MKRGWCAAGLAGLLIACSGGPQPAVKKDGVALPGDLQAVGLVHREGGLVVGRRRWTLRWRLAALVVSGRACAGRSMTVVTPATCRAARA